MKFKQKEDSAIGLLQNYEICRCIIGGKANVSKI